MATVAGTLAVVALARPLWQPRRQGRPRPARTGGPLAGRPAGPGRLGHGGFRPAAVAAASDLPAFRRSMPCTGARRPAAAGLVVGCDFVSGSAPVAARPPAVTATVAAYRRAARWTVTLRLGGAVARLQGVELRRRPVRPALGLPATGRSPPPASSARRRRPLGRHRADDAGLVRRRRAGIGLAACSSACSAASPSETAVSATTSPPSPSPAARRSPAPVRRPVADPPASHRCPPVALLRLARHPPARPIHASIRTDLPEDPS